MSTVKMNASAIGGLIQTAFSGNIQVPTDGVVTVDSRDAITLLTKGATYINAVTRSARISAPIAGAVGQIMASAAATNGTKTIANQPDVARLCSVRIDPGTTAITAGNVAVTYLAVDGSTQVDNLSAVTGVTTISSQNLSKGMVHANSIVITGMAGGASPGIQVDTLNALGVAVDSGYVDFSVVALKVDDADSGLVSTSSAAASFTPSTTPNGTHNYDVWYSYNGPVT